MYCPSFPEAPTMQTLIVCVPERPGHSVSSDSPLDAAIDEGLRGLGAGSDSMRTTPRSGTFREHWPCGVRKLGRACKTRQSDVWALCALGRPATSDRLGIAAYR